MKKANLGDHLDWGFADLQNYSCLNEKEVLFNPVNMFKIQGVQKYEVSIKREGRQVVLKLNRIRLEYGGMKKILAKGEDELTP